MIRIISVGKKHSSHVRELIEDYQKRLRPPFDVEWMLLPHSMQSGSAGAQEESRRILARLNDGAFVILLDERGKQMSSPELSKLVGDTTASGKKVALVIGGAYGVDESVRQRADYVWSLSPLVFPHMLARLVLTEQLYRAQTIVNNEPYHH